MSGNRIKVVGYAQKVFYDNNIEYRDFTSSIIGNQLTNDSGTLLFNSGAFNVTINNDPKTSKSFKTNKLSDYITLNSLNISDLHRTLIGDNVKLKLNLDKSKLTNYAYFGSLKEYVRVSLENIIMSWPASIITVPKLNGIVQNTVEDYTYDNLNNLSSFKVNVDSLNNKFDINYLSNSFVTDLYSTEQYNRSLTTNYSDYVISSTTGEYNIVGYTGSTYDTDDYIYFNVSGNPFSGANLSTYYHIKPNDTKINEFFIGLSEFEGYILNRKSIPLYKSKFSYSIKTEKGIVLDTEKEIIWPADDGYNIDFNTTKYIIFANDLLTLAEESDQIQSNIVSRFLVADTMTDFDTVSDDLDNLSDQKFDKLLKIYGREFDEIKRFSDGISLVNTVTYNKQDNTPDAILKALGRTLGWDLSTSLSDISFTDSYLTPSKSNYSGQGIGLTKHESEIEMWRRIILNTPWIWKSKGTRKAIEFFFKFIGAPNGLIRFNEYIYLANEKLDMVEFNKILEINNGNTDITNITVNNEGYPKPLPDTKDMYFQKAGLWYRQTGGAYADIDILGGNNPHLGPYDGGNEYMNQFRCLIPNFSTTTLIEETITTGKTNLFTNYNDGIINGLVDPISIAMCTLLVDFTNILNTAVNDCFSNTLSEYKCSDGYVLTPNYDACIKVTEEPYISGGTYYILNGTTNSNYSIDGATFFENISDTYKFVYPLTHIPTVTESHNIYDKNADLVEIIGTNIGYWGGKLNSCGIKGDPYTDYKGFSIYLNLLSGETYYLGLGCDGYSKVYIDGDLIIDFSEIPNIGTKESYSTDWHVFPYTFTSGEHYITAVGRNVNTSTGAFGFEVYSASTINQLTGATDNSNVIWTTSGRAFDEYEINLGSTGELIDGFSLDIIDNINRKLEYLPINGIYTDMSDYTYLVDWYLIIEIDGNEVYNSGLFFSGDENDIPDTITYLNSLQTGALVLNLDLSEDGDTIIFTSESDGGCIPSEYYGKTIEIKINLDVTITNNNLNL